MKGPSLALALVLLLVAGCLGSPQTPGATTDPASVAKTIRDASAIVASAGDNLSGRIATGIVPASFYINHSGGEPTIGITKDGSLFYAGATFQNDIAGQDICGQTPAGGNPACLPRTDILRSDDGGATWKDVTPFLPGGLVRSHVDTGDPYVYVDPATSRIFDIDQRLMLTCHTVTYSDDKGATWNDADGKACQTPPADHQTLVAAKPRTLPATPLYPNFVYYCNNQIGASSCARSLDGGQSFTATAPPFLGVDDPSVSPNETDPTNPNINGFCGGLHGHLKAGPDGTVYLPKSQCDKVMTAITQDDGDSWATSTVVNAPGGGDPAMAVDKANHVYMVFESPFDWHLYLASSQDAGAHWSAPLDVTVPGVTTTDLPALVAGDQGRLALAYVGTTTPDAYNITSDNQTALDNLTWDAYLAIITDADGPAPQVTTTRINDAADPVVRGQCGPGRCRALFDFIDVQMDRDGRPWVALVDNCMEKCAAADGKAKDSTASAGFVATLREGPGLLVATPLLPPIHGAGKS